MFDETRGTSVTEPAADIDICATSQQLQRELAKVIVGQEAVVELLVLTLFARGHALFQGVPGLAKTLLVRSLAQATSCSFSRIQFTPDLMPGDITGTEVLDEDRGTGRRQLRFIPGPLFANLVLADEINRTTPKTQAALLEAMQEQRVTAAGTSHELPTPFFVFATQNPLEQEGTYPLPEAQVDRFMFRILVDYPSQDEEMRIAAETTVDGGDEPQPVVSPEQLVAIQALVRQVPAARSVVARAVQLARATRPVDGCSGTVRESVSWGAGPRASQFLILGAKARAILHGRDVASVEDVVALAHPVLDHRIQLTYHALAQGMRTADVVDEVLRSDAPPEL